MPVRLDLVYSDQSAIDWKEAISCRHCKTPFVAVVRAHGTGTGTATYGIGKRAAAERAGMEAFSNATDEGQSLIRLRRCPRCRKSLGENGGVVAATAIRTGVAAVFIGPLLTLPFQMGPEVVQTIGGLLICPAFLGSWWRLYRWQFDKRMAEADKRVQLERAVQGPG